MDFRRLFGFFRHAGIRPDTEQEPATHRTPLCTHVRYAEAYPAHTCVDQPILPCPACLKWTGDGFASVKGNPEGFPGIFGQPETKPIQYEPPGYAVMILVKLVDGWVWRTWMYYDTYEQAASHVREGQKIVPFGSDEWKALLQRPTQDAPERPNVQDLVEGETLVESVLQFLDAYDPTAEADRHIDCTSANPVEDLKSCEVTKSSESGEHKSSADRVCPQSDSESETLESPDPPRHGRRDSLSQLLP